jgi:nucleoside-diphosphate-sugar epimerase
VIHSAACVRFEDPLKPTLITNLRGTAEVVQLCKEIEKLQSFVYVSTAYSNCYNFDIEEKTYETSIDPSQLINCVKWMSEEQMEALAPQ